MKSKISLIDKGILYHDLKSSGWVGIIYLLGLLFAFPMQILMLHSQEVNMLRTYDIFNNPYLGIFQVNSPIQMLLLVVIPVLTGLLLFRYLQSGKAADMIHALPIKRRILYNTHITAGIIFLFVPLIITAFLSWAAISSLGIDLVSIQDIMNWLGSSLIINLLLLISTSAVAMFTGMTSLQGILTYIMLLLPVGLSMLLLNNMHMYVYGLAYDYYLLGLGKLYPIINIINFKIFPFSGRELIINLLIILALYFIGRYAYQKRPSEMAGNAIAFEILRPIFKYGVAFCTMLLVGSYFYSAQGSLSWTYFGYLIGSLIGFLLAEILIKKSISIFNLKLFHQYAFLAIAVVLLIACVNTDVIGYEKRMPDLTEVTGAYFDESFYNLSRTKDNSTKDMTCMFIEDQNIAHIYELHKSIIARGKQESLKVDVYDTHSFAYQLKDGSIFYRQYKINRDDYTAHFKQIYESREYKHLCNDIFHITPDNIDLIEIYANGVNKKVRVVDPTLIRQAINVLQKDVLLRTYEQMTSNQASWAHIRILLNDDHDHNVYLDWEKSDINFGNWLKSIGKYDNARVIPSEDIEYAVVEKRVNSKENSFDEYSDFELEQYLKDIKNEEKYLKIIDPEPLESCLANYTSTVGEPGYSIIFLLNNGRVLRGELSNNNAPESVKEFFTGK
jgi:ABC-2 type transport system permease protein